MPTAAESFAEWALGLELAGVPKKTRRAACRHLLDGIGTAIAAARLGAASPAVAVARGWAADEATVLGHGHRVAAPMAALANGALVHALDFDDTHTEALVHATAAVLPAAFAVGEKMQASGASVLTACLAGYEVVIRLGAAVRHGFHTRGFHATSVCGVFSAALISARLMGLSVKEAVNAMGIAGSLASGSLEFLHDGSSTKQLHPGLAGMSGILAARFAAEGADGPATILEGNRGFYHSFAGHVIDPDSVVEGLGTRWETERITIKPFPACQLSHAPLDALLPLLDQIKDAREIDEIVFTLPPESVPIISEPAEAKRRPRTSYDAKFSLPYCAAALLVEGEVQLDSFDPERLERPEILDLASHIGYRTLEFAGAPADAPGVVEIRLRDGRMLQSETRSGKELGSLPEDRLMAKFFSNCGGESKRSHSLAETVFGMADLADVGRLLSSSTSFVPTPDSMSPTAAVT